MNTERRAAPPAPGPTEICCVECTTYFIPSEIHARKCGWVKGVKGEWLCPKCDIHRNEP